MNIKLLYITFGVIVSIFLLMFLTKNVNAHPGNTDSQGCHTCRTNCPSWGLYYDEYHCHTPKYHSPSETYTPPPSCPLFSYYDSLADSCKCYSGYVASGDRCVSKDDLCREQFGFNSRYNSLKDACECSYGYVVDEGRCVSGNQSCGNKYGYNSSYDSLSKSCKCHYGYVFNEAGTQCISEDQWCREQLGFGSEYDSLESSCVCSDGYRFSDDECVLKASDYRFTPPNTPSLPTTKPTHYPFSKDTPKPSVSSDETQSENPSLTIEPTKQYDYPYKLQTELKLNSRGEEVKILQSALATDKELYPEGIINGFFGIATEKAVKRFQKINGLEETGAIDPETLSTFNEIFREQVVSATPTPSPALKKENILIKIWHFLTWFF